MTRFALRALSIIGVIVLILALLLLAKTTQNSEEFSRLHYFIVMLNAAGLVLLSSLLLLNFYRLVRDHRKGVPGARLKSRMIGMFAVLAMLPLLLVYLFSMYFLNRGIDSYFDVDVSRGLDDALTLSRTVLEVRMQEHMQHIEVAARVVSRHAEPNPLELEKLRHDLVADKLLLISGDNKVMAWSVIGRAPITGSPLPLMLAKEVQSGQPLIDIEPSGPSGLLIRAARLAGSVNDPRQFLYAEFPVGENIAQLADSVQKTYSHHDNLVFLREPLIDSFKLTLTLVLLVSSLLTLGGIFFIARRLVQPIQDLVAGTRAVAAGDFEMQLPKGKKDDIGFLVESFNSMTRRLSLTSEIEIQSRAAVEAERSNLATILGSLSSGVIALERDFTVRSVNEAALNILGHEEEPFQGQALADLKSTNGMAEQLALVCYQHLSNDRLEWREQIELQGETSQVVLSCACTPLHFGDDEKPNGFVIVFEDVTVLLQAEKEAAWGEVARRLAHEIKNPLTPIQLSAERMRRKYLKEMTAQESDVLERATRTIVQQVETMKQMVDAFRDYARAPEMDIVRFDLNRLVSEVVDLYRGGDQGIHFDLDLDHGLLDIEADSGRLRQILHNLLRNAVEALHEHVNGSVLVGTKKKLYKKQSVAEISILDNGPGFKKTMVRSVFEPYVTTKAKGTGLGLAIVKKLVEEHGGTITLENREEGGACVRILLPIDKAARLKLINSQSVEESKRESA